MSQQGGHTRQQYQMEPGEEKKGKHQVNYYILHSLDKLPKKFQLNNYHLKYCTLSVPTMGL